MRKAILLIAGILLVAGIGSVAASAQGPPDRAQDPGTGAGSPPAASDEGEQGSSSSDAGPPQAADSSSPTAEPATGEAEPASAQPATPTGNPHHAETTDAPADSPPEAQPSTAAEDPQRSTDGPSERSQPPQDTTASADRSEQASPRADPPDPQPEPGTGADGDAPAHEGGPEPDRARSETGEEDSEQADDGTEASEDAPPPSDGPETPRQEARAGESHGAVDHTDEDPDPRTEATPEEDEQAPEQPPEPAEATTESPSGPADAAGPDWAEPLADLSPTLEGADTGTHASIAPGAAATTSSGDADGGLWPGLGLIAFALGVSTLVVRPRVRLQIGGEPEPQPAQTGSDDPERARPALTGAQTPGPEGLLLLGQEALDRGEYETAIGWFETAIALDPELQTAHLCIGLCLDEMGRLEQAADALAHACRLSHGPMTEYVHASVLARLGRTQEAVRKLERVVDESPGLVDQLASDEDLAVLSDHPRFLALVGEI